MSRLKITLLLSYICIASISSAIITPALPQIEQTFHLGHGSVEWVITVFLIGYMAGQLIYAPLANRYGRLKALRAGLVINLLGVVICLTAIHFNSFGDLLFGRLVTALGAASGLACTFMLINELLEPEVAKQVIAVAIVSFTLGVGIAIFIGGLIAQYIGWTFAFWVLLLHGVFMLVCTWQFPETLKQKVPISVSTIVRGFTVALESKTLMLFSVIYGFCAVVTYTYTTAGPLIAHQVLKLEPSLYGVWNCLTMIGMLIGGFGSAWLLKTMSPLRLLAYAIVLTAVSLASLVVMRMMGSHSALWFFLSTGGLYCFSSVIFPCSAFYASNAIADTASASSMMNFINMGLATVMVAVMGYLPFGPLTSFVIVLVAFNLLVFMLYGVGRRLV